jgi:hypothetical protein
MPASPVVEFRIELGGADRAGKGRLEIRPVAVVPGKTEFIPLPDEAPTPVPYP